MKKMVYGFLFLIIFELIFLPMKFAFAGGEIGKYNVSTEKDYRLKKKTMIYRKRCNRGPFIMYPGSLKDNIERLAANHCWYVVKWKADSDFEWVGDEKGTLIRASTLQDALRKVLHKYPLQAQFYMGNHVLAIESRTLKNEL